MTYDTDHARFRDDIGAYLAGGLTADEQQSFEAHAAACAECAAALSEAAAEEKGLQTMFADALPAPGLEDRILTRLRSGVDDARGRLRVRLHPAVRRAAVGVAAAVMLAGFGYVATETINRGGLPVTGVIARREPARTPTNLRQIGQRNQTKANEDKANYPRAFFKVEQGGEQPAVASPAEMARQFFESNGQRFHQPPAKTQWGLVAAGQVDSDAKRSSPAENGRRPGTPDLSLQSTASQSGGGGGGSGRGLFRDNIYAYKVQNAGKAAVPDGTAAPVAGDAAVTAPVEGLAKKVDGLADAQRGPTLGLAYGTFKPADQQGQNAPFADGHVTLEGGLLADRFGLSQASRAKDGAVEDQVKGEAEVDAKALKNAQDGDGDRLGRESDVRRLTEVAEARPAPAQSSAGQQGAGQPNGAQPAPATAPAAPPPPDPAANVNAGRKIIRNGEMSFEVDSFDSSYLQITKIAAEEGGFVATTDSEKLANGKVRGVVTVRVPPERLDTLVLKLRGLGELKSSRIAAQDITKQYTDLESQLKAARAMEERLLNVIKTGKGEIKDLVEAEKQLGVYREKIEQVEGEVRYYNNLVSLSTLNVTLAERDIRTAALLSETEQVNMGVEAEDVEKARAAAIKAIEEAKGRVVESDLKKLEAGQFAARVVADVPPDAAGPLIDRMRQVGAVARLEVARKQTTPAGTVAPAQGAAVPRVERRDTRFLISLYNLANVAPRQMTNLNLAADDVEVAYRTILDQVKSAGGRIVASQLNRPRPDQTTGTVTFEAPADKADVLLGAVRANGEVMRLDVNQNPDTQNVTETKRGFALQIFSLASVAPRETTTLRLAARGVPDAFNRLREAVRNAAGGRVLASQLSEQDAASVTGTLDFEVRREGWPSVDTALREAGQVLSRSVTRSSDTENTVDSKVRLQVALADEAALAPRESVTIQLAVGDVPAQYAKLLEALGAAQARVLQSQLNEQQKRDDVTATLVFDVRRESRAAVDKAVSEAGDVVSRSVARSTDVQNTLDDKVRVSLTVGDADRVPPRETTVLGIEARDVEAVKEAVESLALGLGGRVVNSTLSRETDGRVMAKVVADVPLGKAMEMVAKTRGQGRVQFRRDSRDENVPAGSLSRYRVEVTLANEELMVESGRGLGARIREGLRTSVTGLLWSVQLIVIGLFLVAPWVLVVWFAWRVARRGRGKPAGATTTPAPA